MDASRAHRLECGHEVLDPKQWHYCRYMNLAELLKLQNEEDGAQKHLHPDELFFIVVHQTLELWFKLLIADIQRAIAQIQQDNTWHALHLIRRLTEISRLFLQQIRLPETLSTPDFITFRARLPPASGLESEQFRAIEILSGLRGDKFVAALNKRVGDTWEKDSEDIIQTKIGTERLQNFVRSASLNSAFADLLRRREVEVIQLYSPSDERNEHEDLHQLAEALLDYDQMFGLFRFTHAAMVERTLGTDTGGTAGSLGYKYLYAMVHARGHFFPDLWKVRADLIQRSKDAIAANKKAP